MNKNELRKRVLKTRMALTAEEVINKSEKILKRLMSLKEYQQATTVMTYLDFRNEVKTEGLILKSLFLGKRIVVPLTDIRAKQLTPSLLINYPDDLAPGNWGILEPAKDFVRPVEPKEIDLVVVPGVAFDEKGDRLGYGGGFYDRFLPQTRSDAFFVSPAYELQILPEIHTGPYDCPVHCLVTEERTIYVK